MNSEKEMESKGNDSKLWNVRPFGRVCVVALLGHRMCVEQCESIHLTVVDSVVDIGGHC